MRGYKRRECRSSQRAQCGLDLARGELVAFLDATTCGTVKACLQIARFQKRPDLQFVLRHVENFWMPSFAMKKCA